MNYYFRSISQRVSKQMRKTRPYQFGVCWLHISDYIDLHLESDVSIFLERTTKQHFHQRHVLPMQMKLNTVNWPACCLTTYLHTQNIWRIPTCPISDSNPHHLSSWPFLEDRTRSHRNKHPLEPRTVPPPFWRLASDITASAGKGRGWGLYRYALCAVPSRYKPNHYFYAL